jgi:uncharacterized protein YyaL (SSP411 family)
MAQRSAPPRRRAARSAAERPVTTAAKTAPANRLAREKSPYLLQHQYNPVDWRPWGDEAFATAERENRPVFLSIGYSTCHWCHVMERESFENEDLARFLNEHFVSIKVDREERPDVDKIYMTFVQATTRQGGWPLSVFLLPDRKPFFGGTYFPPDTRYGRASFRQILEQVHKVWTARRAELADSAGNIQSQIQELNTASPDDTGEGVKPAALDNAAAMLKAAYDPRHGGFGGAPKFPHPSQPQFLLRHASRVGDKEAISMVLHTCDRMAAGGIHDQLGGGFARYSVDAEWLVPHFEKMLYDNAQLTQLYLDAWLVSGDARHAEAARDIVDYVLRDMTHPEGGFFSAEDADSEGHEGKFYCWTREELASLLAPDEFAAAARYFGITKDGNFVDHSHPEPLPGQNVLSVVDPDLSAVEQQALASAKRKMLEARARRVRPQLDDKVLASWNGLMLGAIARAGAVLGDEPYAAAAAKNLAVLKANLWDAETKTLHHRWRNGERDNVELLEGYAFLLSGVIDFYEAALEPAALDFAISLADAMLAKFYDAEHGGFWQSPAHASDLILRMKDDYDGAEPSGNSVAVMSLLRLGKITERRDFTEAAEKTLRLFSGRLQQAPQALPCMLQALEFFLHEPRRVVVAGDSALPEARALLRAANSVFQPNKVVLGNSGAVELFARNLPAREGPMAYVCTGTACQPPTRNPDELRALLRAPATTQM